MKSKFSKFNDGMLKICIQNQKKTNFAAVQNVTKSAELNIVSKMAYGEMSKRAEDMEFAESQGRSLSMKVRVRLVDFINNSHSVLIGNTLYDIYKLDSSREKQEMYLYLEEVRTVE